MSIIKYKPNDDVNIEKLRELSYIDMYKCVNACWYYLENLSGNVWSENEAKIILAECFIENNDVEAALAVLGEVLINDKYNYDALKLIIAYCMDSLDIYESKTIGTLAILAYEKFTIEYARKGENVPTDMTILLGVEGVGSGLFDDEVITVVDRERDIVNVRRELSHIAQMYGYGKALEILNSNYACLSDIPSFIALKARYNYYCGNYMHAAELAETIDNGSYNAFCAIAAMRAACEDYYNKVDSGVVSETHDKALKAASERVALSDYDNIEDFLLALETLFYAKEYDIAIELIENGEFTANSKVLMYLAAAKSNIGEEEESIVTFKLAHNIYGKYCDAGFNFADGELFIPDGGEFTSRDVTVFNRDIAEEINGIINDVYNQAVVTELSEALAVAIAHAYAAVNLDKLSTLICDKFSDDLIKSNNEFFKRMTYNAKLPNRIKADILFRLMMAYPKKYIACGFGKVVHFTKYLIDEKLMADEFRFKTYLFALSRKYIYHDTNYSYEYDVIFRKFDILFPSNLKLDRDNYQLAALIASKMCFYYKPIFSDDMLCSEFGIATESFHKAYEAFNAVNRDALSENEALCSKEFGYEEVLGILAKRKPEDIALTQADIENLKHHPKVKFYDFASRKSDGTE